MFLLAMDAGTTPDKRKAAVSALMYANQAGAQQETEDSSGGVVQLVHRVGCLLTSYCSPECPIRVQPELPHIRLPVGLEENRLTILSVIDSGGALNLGSYAYHKGVATLYPEVVSELKPWEAYTRIQRIQIFGVSAADVDAVEVTHIIRYKTPFRDGGKPFLVSFGLSETTSCTALLGIPFHVDGKVIPNYATRTVYVTAFNEEFKMEFHIPTVRHTPNHRTGRNLPTALVGTTEAANTEGHEQGREQDAPEEPPGHGLILSVGE